MILPWLKQKGFYDSEVRLILIDEKAKLQILSWSVKWERNTSRQQKKLINYVTKGENSKRTLMNGFSCSGKEDVDMFLLVDRKNRTSGTIVLDPPESCNPPEHFSFLVHRACRTTTDGVRVLCFDY